jgi:hypothetical protein
LCDIPIKDLNPCFSKVLRQAQYCKVCKAKVVKAFSILTGREDHSVEEDEVDDAFCPEMFQHFSVHKDNRQILRCLPNKVTSLVAFYERELCKANLQERHASTIQDAQNECLLVLGMYFSENIPLVCHRRMLKNKEASVAVKAAVHSLSIKIAEECESLDFNLACHECAVPESSNAGSDNSPNNRRKKKKKKKRKSTKEKTGGGEDDSLKKTEDFDAVETVQRVVDDAETGFDSKNSVPTQDTSSTLDDESSSSTVTNTPPPDPELLRATAVSASEQPTDDYVPLQQLDERLRVATTQADQAVVNEAIEEAKAWCQEHACSVKRLASYKKAKRWLKVLQEHGGTGGLSGLNPLLGLLEPQPPSLRALAPPFRFPGLQRLATAGDEEADAAAEAEVDTRKPPSPLPPPVAHKEPHEIAAPKFPGLFGMPTFSDPFPMEEYALFGSSQTFLPDAWESDSVFRGGGSESILKEVLIRPPVRPSTSAKAAKRAPSKVKPSGTLVDWAAWAQPRGVFCPQTSTSTCVALSGGDGWQQEVYESDPATGEVFVRRGTSRHVEHAAAHFERSDCGEPK